MSLPCPPHLTHPRPPITVYNLSSWGEPTCATYSNTARASRYGGECISCGTGQPGVGGAYQELRNKLELVMLTPWAAAKRTSLLAVTPQCTSMISSVVLITPWQACARKAPCHTSHHCHRHTDTIDNSTSFIMLWGFYFWLARRLGGASALQTPLGTS